MSHILSLYTSFSKKKKRKKNDNVFDYFFFSETDYFKKSIRHCMLNKNIGINARNLDSDQ